MCWNSSRVVWVRNSGRSSGARHTSAASTARAGSGRGRPVRLASAASMIGALPERSINSAARATVSSLTLPPAGGRVRPPPLLIACAPRASGPAGCPWRS